MGCGVGVGCGAGCGWEVGAGFGVGVGWGTGVGPGVLSLLKISQLPRLPASSSSNRAVKNCLRGRGPAGIFGLLLLAFMVAGMV